MIYRVTMKAKEVKVSGIVVHGAGRGKELGFPTANLDTDSSALPESGIYAAKVMIEGEKKWRTGAANIGINPTFGDEGRKLEVYIIDYHGDLYGKKLKIRLGFFIRPEKRFKNKHELIVQMEKDCRVACAFYSHKLYGTETQTKS